jgi:hypothetical protein
MKALSLASVAVDLRVNQVVTWSRASRPCSEATRSARTGLRGL